MTMRCCRARTRLCATKNRVKWQPSCLTAFMLAQTTYMNRWRALKLWKNWMRPMKNKMRAIEIFSKRCCSRLRSCSTWTSAHLTCLLVLRDVDEDVPYKYNLNSSHKQMGTYLETVGRQDPNLALNWWRAIENNSVADLFKNKIYLAPLFFDPVIA